MDKAFKLRTRDHYFDIKERLEAHLGAKDEVFRALRTASVVNSSALDDPSVDPVFLYLALDRLPERRWERIAPDYGRAMCEVTALYNITGRIEELALAKHSLAVPLILQLHRTLFERTRYSDAGKFRAGDDIEPMTECPLPHHSKLPELFEHHLTWLINRLRIFGIATKDNFMEMFHIAAEAHYRIATTLPFECGNGRVARLIGDYVLIYTGLQYALILSHDREEYLDAVRSSAIDSLTPLVNYLITAFEATLKRLDGFVALTESAKQEVYRNNLS
ncbi:MAG: Fic family protein [Candidatus Zixiibacteriota bacterium]